MSRTNQALLLLLALYIPHLAFAHYSIPLVRVDASDVENPDNKRLLSTLSTSMYSSTIYAVYTSVGTQANVPMGVMISSPYSFVASSSACGNFNGFSCSSLYSCTSNSGGSTFQVTYPLYSYYYTGTQAMTSVSISSAGTYFYNIPSTQGIGYGGSCSGSTYSSYSLYGAIGMGLPSSSSLSPFPTGITQFAITYYSTSSATLTLGPNTYLGPSFTVSANSNWQSTFTSVSIGSTTPYYSTSYVTWELGFQGIGVPQTLYNQINSTLAASGAVCSPTSTMSTYYHYCTLSVPLSSLPNVVISLSSSQSITIPPYAYMGNSSSGLNYLVFTSTTTSSLSGNITVQSGFGSNIIMGSDAFAYFLPVFDSSNYNNPQITIYLQSENGLAALASLVGQFLLYIILGIVVSIIACCVCCCCICKASTRYVPPVAETIIVTDPGIQMTPMNGQPGYNPYAQPQPFGQPNPYGQPQPFVQPYGQPMMTQPGVGQPMLAQPYNNQF